jgi:hypothetical protein
MNKKVVFTVVILALIAAMLFTGCGKSKKLGPGDVLDNDTGNVFSLGDPKEKFDAAFGSSAYNKYTHGMEYLSKTISVEFDESDCAVSITVYGGTNRFSFYDFDFSKPLEDIAGRYNKIALAGADAYSMCYSMDGEKIDQKEAYLLDSFIRHSLHVRTTDQEISGLKAGDYQFYIIEYAEGITHP